MFQDGSVEAFFAKSADAALRPGLRWRPGLLASRPESSLETFPQARPHFALHPEKAAMRRRSTARPYEVPLPQKTPTKLHTPE